MRFIIRFIYIKVNADFVGVQNRILGRVVKMNSIRCVLNYDSYKFNMSHTKFKKTKF